MPSRRTRFAVFDTSIYIENFRTDRFTAQIARSTFIPRCSSVVVHELLRGARTREEEAFARGLMKTCRILNPTEPHWYEAAEVLRALRRREHYDAAKARELVFDVLIALSARSIGATLFTSNRSDFQAIHRHLRFEVVYW
jgi:predicted nucleic acid-binding protein